MTSVSNRCGGCTLCCKVLQVDQFDAPAGTQCKHACETGCGIWAERPRFCRSFDCLWYANPKFPDDLRPDQCGVVFEPGGDRILLAMVDESRPTAWQEGIADTLIRKYIADGTVVIVQIGTEKHFLLPEGETMNAAWARVVVDSRRREMESRVRTKNKERRENQRRIALEQRDRQRKRRRR